MSRHLEASSQTVSDAELHPALERSLSSHFGKRRSITKLERRRSPYRTSFALEELDAHLDDDTTVQLIFKDLSWKALPTGASRAKPTFLYEPLREILTYRTILPSANLGTAICYGTVVDAELDRYWLFLEKVPGIELHQVGDLRTWQQAAGWLATMHTLFSGEIELLRKTAPLLTHNAEFYWQWLRRAQTFSGQLSSSQTGDAKQKLARVAERYHRIVEHLISMPPTFIHGEFYASNVLVQESEDRTRVCPIDWETAAAGPGLMDLAALVAGNWTEEEKTTIAQGYYAALPPDNGWRESPEAFMVALDYCKLALAVQWLGWAPDWSPPAEHAHDWLSEAIRLDEKLSV